MTAASPAIRDGAELRRRRRAVLRAHHPDLGGDPEELLRELRNLDAELEALPRYPEVAFVRRSTWPRRAPQVLRRLPRIRRRWRT